jgi:putative dimethyl sulfoxide reductase chaperone
MTYLPVESNPEVTVDSLFGEYLLFGVLGKLLYKYPDQAWYQSLADDEIFIELPVFSEQAELHEGISLLKKWSENYQGGAQGRFDELRNEYTRLFIGLGTVLAPPWESVFFSEKRLIFQEETLQVRSWYRQFGLEVEKINHEPDDHLGLELAFLAHLSGLAAEALQNSDLEKYEEIQKAYLQFLIEHPLRWAEIWCEQVLAHAQTDFFRGLALIIKGVFVEKASAVKGLER